MKIYTADTGDTGDQGMSSQDGYLAENNYTKCTLAVHRTVPGALGSMGGHGGSTGGPSRIWYLSNCRVCDFCRVSRVLLR
jgi:hypothetical protein